MDGDVGGRMPRSGVGRFALVVTLLPALTAGVALAEDAPRPAIVHHQVHATLDVPGQRLAVIDRIRVEPSPAPDEPIRCLLHADLALEGVTLADGATLEYTEETHWDPRHFWRRPPYAELDRFDIAREITVEPPAAGWGPSPELQLRYAGVIADSLHSPERAYGRSFETTTGRIVERGAYLCAATFWVPWSGERPFTFELQVSGPAPWSTISQGRAAEPVASFFAVHDAASPIDAPPRNVNRWICEHPMQEIYLIAGPYEIRRRNHDGVSLETWTYANTKEDLCTTYLDEAARTIDHYSDSIGPYPFSKFALVENYWQSGYGMPSFTFLGDRVIRLPFIVHTSFPHEILHNWWGNSVYVEGGNWCEGLTTYCADYAAKERESDVAARDYRRDQLVGYRDFARNGGGDFALSRFRERDSAATQAVGYGKTLMIFHMLRTNLGDRRFQEGLRRLYRERRFRATGWDDVRDAFGSRGELNAWFEQWVERPGAIQLSLEEVSSAPRDDGWVVRGTLVQDDPPYSAMVPLEIVGGAPGQVFRAAVESRGGRVSFELQVPFAPRHVAADPGFDLFRVLHDAEVAPVLSGVLGAAATRIVLGSDVQGDLRDALRALADDWARDPTFTILEEAETPAVGANDRFVGATWYFGDGPAAAAFRSSLGEVAEAGTLVAAGRVDGDPERPAAILRPESARIVPAIGRKIPHYSKYSVLVFEGETNVVKRLWPPGESPLTVRLHSVDSDGDFR